MGGAERFPGRKRSTAVAIIISAESNHQLYVRRPAAGLRLPESTTAQFINEELQFVEAAYGCV